MTWHALPGHFEVLRKIKHLELSVGSMAGRMLVDVKTKGKMTSVSTIPETQHGCTIRANHERS